MEISKNNFTLWLIQSTFGSGKYPKDFCSFFWLAVASYVLFIPLIWMHIAHFTTHKFFSKSWNLFEENEISWFGRIFFFWVFPFFICVEMLFKIFDVNSHLTYYYAFLSIPLLFIIAIIILLIVTFIIDKVEEWKENRPYVYKKPKPIKPKKVWFIVEYVKSVKEKHCKVIQYK